MWVNCSGGRAARQHSAHSFWSEALGFPHNGDRQQNTQADGRANRQVIFRIKPDHARSALVLFPMLGLYLFAYSCYLFFIID